MLYRDSIWDIFPYSVPRNGQGIEVQSQSSRFTGLRGLPSLSGIIWQSFFVMANTSDNVQVFLVRNPLQMPHLQQNLVMPASCSPARIQFRPVLDRMMATGATVIWGPFCSKCLQ